MQPAKNQARLFNRPRQIHDLGDAVLFESRAIHAAVEIYEQADGAPIHDWI